MSTNWLQSILRQRILWLKAAFTSLVNLVTQVLLKTNQETNHIEALKALQKAYYGKLAW